MSAQFLVIAIGLPVPKYDGHPLDPPLRSRFACRHVPTINIHHASRHSLSELDPLAEGRAASLMTSAEKLISQIEKISSAPSQPKSGPRGSKGAVGGYVRLPRFPDCRVHYVTRLLEKCASLSAGQALTRIFPVADLGLPEEHVRTLAAVLPVDTKARAGTKRMSKMEMQQEVGAVLATVDASLRAPPSNADSHVGGVLPERTAAQLTQAQHETLVHMLQVRAQ